MTNQDAFLQEDTLDQINYFIPGPNMDETLTSTMRPSGNGTKQGVVIRGEEVGIVLVVLFLWVGAIVLFFNRWGKIRMLEPYQPKFCEHHDPLCPMADVPAIVPANYPRSFSKFNLAEAGASPHFAKCNYHGVTTTIPCATEPLLNNGGGSMPIPGGSRSMSISMGGLGIPSTLTLQGPGLSPRLGGGRGQNRLRQNSVFVTSPSNFPISIFGENAQLGKNTGGRKTKSAVDLSTLVLSNEIMNTVRRNSKNSITNL